ncbi:MAG TPA: tyrosine--tRNA ligase [Candidatus Kapabacteria bacterium]|nr:tyrosine--tRNA ligase [Candidatus Kapabacteria bacterium]
MSFLTINEQMDIIREGAVDIIPEEELVKKLERSIENNKPLIIKLGADPSRPDLHIGHAVVLHKMRQFQDLGHVATLIIGDFTGMIGDPTGRNKTRPPLTLEEARKNGISYLEQATLILSKERLQVRYNSEWLGKMSFRDVIELASKYTVAQLLERDDFSKRYREGIPISVHELLYPLAQAMDSVAIGADVELGGTDQKFNLLVGREIQRSYGMEPQCILTVPILEGIDGVEKMSKSYNNYIALTDPPDEMFGKIMSIPDKLIGKYLLYAAFENPKEVEKIQKQIDNNEINPRDAKVTLAMKIVEKYHSKEAAQQALENFEKIFKKKELPDELPEFILQDENTSLNIQDILVISQLAPSKKEAKRLIEQGGVYINNEKLTDPFAKIDLSEPKIFKVGKRKFLKIILNK